MRRRYPLTARQRAQLALDEFLSERAIRRWEVCPDDVTANVRLRCERGVRRMGLDPATLPRAA